MMSVNGLSFRKCRNLEKKSWTVLREKLVMKKTAGPFKITVTRFNESEYRSPVIFVFLSKISVNFLMKFPKGLRYLTFMGKDGSISFPRRCHYGRYLGRICLNTDHKFIMKTYENHKNIHNYAK